MRNIALKQVLADSLIDNVRKHSNHVFILECLFGKGNSLANLKVAKSQNFPPSSQIKQKIVCKVNFVKVGMKDCFRDLCNYPLLPTGIFNCD